jgi:hypothetical protein
LHGPAKPESISARPRAAASTAPNRSQQCRQNIHRIMQDTTSISHNTPCSGVKRMQFCPFRQGESEFDFPCIILKPNAA